MDRLEERLVAILSRYCGERGQSEGAVETLERIVHERDMQATNIVRLEAEIESLRTQLGQLHADIYAMQDGSLVQALRQQLAIHELREGAVGRVLDMYTADIEKKDQQLASANEEVERLTKIVEEREGCAYMGPSRDCPTHGESHEISVLQAQLAEKDTVPRSRYDAVNQDWLNEKGKRVELTKKAEIEVERLEVQLVQTREALVGYEDIKCYSCRGGWVCEKHPDFGWPHIDKTGNDCPGPGQPCESRQCIYYWRFNGPVLEKQLADEKEISAGMLLKVREITKEADRLEAQLAQVREALQEISEGKGPFDRDPLTHASNTIEAMKELATKALERPK